MITHCEDHRVLRASQDARSLTRPSRCFDGLGMLACGLLPLLAWWFLQDQSWALLTKNSLSNGCMYTLWTGHLLHFTFEHFVWDALMFVCFAVLLWREEHWRLWGWLLLGAPLISIAVFGLEPDLFQYRGLSALDSMLFTRYCFGICIRSKAWDRVLFGLLPLAGLGVKIAYEFSSGSTLFVSNLGAGVVPLPSAHFAGLLIGCAWGLVCWGRRRRV